jgi:hypothetical protein
MDADEELPSMSLGSPSGDEDNEGDDDKRDGDTRTKGKRKLDESTATAEEYWLTIRRRCELCKQRKVCSSISVT